MKQTHKVIATSAIDDVLAEFAGEERMVGEELVIGASLSHLINFQKLNTVIDSEEPTAGRFFSCCFAEY